MLWSHSYGAVQHIQLSKTDVKTNTKIIIVAFTINNGINKMDIFKLVMGKTN